MKSRKSMELFSYMIDKGYPKEFAKHISDTLNTEWTASRMLGYLYHYDKLPLEEIADEMFAILNDRNRIIKKKELEHAQNTINIMYNFGLGIENEKDD